MRPTIRQAFPPERCDFWRKTAPVPNRTRGGSCDPRQVPPRVSSWPCNRSSLALELPLRAATRWSTVRRPVLWFRDSRNRSLSCLPPSLPSPDAGWTCRATRRRRPIPVVGQIRRLARSWVSTLAVVTCIAACIWTTSAMRMSLGVRVVCGREVSGRPHGEHGPVLRGDLMTMTDFEVERCTRHCAASGRALAEGKISTRSCCPTARNSSDSTTPSKRGQVRLPKRSAGGNRKCPPAITSNRSSPPARSC